MEKVTASEKGYIFNTAWEMVKEGKVEDIAEALRLAWKAAKIIDGMREGVQSFVFTKVSTKTDRLAKGTLNIDTMIAHNYSPSFRKGRKAKTKKFSVIEYFDCEKQSWRSFTVQNLK